MSALFDHIISKFETAINVRVPVAAPASGSNSTAAAASTAITGADGMSAIAMLAVLTDFEASYRESMIIQYSAQAGGSSGTTTTQRTGKHLRLAVPDPLVSISISIAWLWRVCEQEHASPIYYLMDNR
jgi:uncharacterized protein (UPF0261 family)